MIPTGTQIRLKLPEDDEEVEATVMSCSEKGRRCTLKVDGTRVMTINIANCRYSIITDSTGVQAAEAVGTQQEDQRNVSSTELDPTSLDAFADVGISTSTIDRLQEEIHRDAGVLVRASPEVANMARSATALLLQYWNEARIPSSSSEPSVRRKQSEEAIYVDGFDAEQIWLQLDMIAAPAIRKARKQLKRTRELDVLIPRDVEEALDDLLMDEQEKLGETESSDSQLFETPIDGSEDDIRASIASQDDGGGDDGEDDVLDIRFKDASNLELNANDYYRMLEDGVQKELHQEDMKIKGAKFKEKGGKTKRKLTGAEARAAIEDEHFKLDELEEFLISSEKADAGSEEDNDESEDVRDDSLRHGVEASTGLESDEEGLDALMTKASKLVGRVAVSKKDGRKKGGLYGALDNADADDDDDDDAPVDLATDPLANACYEDFFGTSPEYSQDRKNIKSQTNGVGTGLESSREDIDIDDFDDVYDDDGENDFSDNGEEEEGMESSEDEDVGREEFDDVEEHEISAEDSEDLHLGRSTTHAEFSAHERRSQKTAAKISELEAQAMSEKDWYLRGEISASSRPKNSALEIDLDFETTIRPPPAPTEEATQNLEEMIRRRIYEGHFDDVVKIKPSDTQKIKNLVELDDKKSSIGLGELYEKDYLTAVTGNVEDKDEPVRELARAQFEALCAVLDRLSHGSFRPLPSIEEVTVKTDVPAILMEEAAPAFVSVASMRAPEEVFVAGRKQLGAHSGKTKAEGEPGDNLNEETGAEAPLSIVPMGEGTFKSETELTTTDRKRRRAALKRALKKRRLSQEEEKASKLSARGEVYIPGRKSEADAAALRKMSKAAKATTGNDIKYSKSSSVFAKIQSATKQGNSKSSGRSSGMKASHLKL